MEKKTWQEIANEAAPLKPGDFVRYTYKNELGLVGKVRDDSTVYCWFHLGGTMASTPTHLLERVSQDELRTSTFSNEYVRKSLIERRRRLFAGEDVSDLIDI